MGRSRYRFVEPGQFYFVTATAVGWLPVFTRPRAVEIVLDSLRFLQQQNRMTVYGYVVMENHLHLVASAADMGKEMGDFKSFTAKRIIELLQSTGETALLDQLRNHKAAHKTDREFQLWQEGSHPQMIQGEAMMRQKLEYIHDNPVRRGYVDDPTHWRYSSARNYFGKPGLLEVQTRW